MQRERFKRATKTTLSIRKSDLGAGLRALLTKRVQPMVTYLVAEMAELAAQRFEQELERMCEGLEVAVSAFVSEVANNDLGEPELAASYDPSDVLGVGTRVHRDTPAPFDGSPLPERCGKHACAERRQCAARTRLCNCEECRAELDRVRGGVEASTRAAVPEPAVAAEQGSASSRPGIIEETLGPDIAKALGEPVVDRDTKPTKGRGHGARICSRCGTEGHYARTCKRDVPTPAVDRTPIRIDVPPPPVRRLTAKPEALEARKHIIAARATTGDRPPMREGIRNPDRPVAHRDDDQDDNPNADELWTYDEILEVRAAAHANKHASVEPDIKSTWVF